MDTQWARSYSPAVTDVYTDLSGLQNLKAEKNQELALKKVSEQFESMFVSLLLKNMRAANKVFSEGNMFDSNEAQFYQDMHDQQLSLSLASGRGFGIAEAMYRQLSQNYGGDFQAPLRQVFTGNSRSNIDSAKADNSDFNENQAPDKVDIVSQTTDVELDSKMTVQRAEIASSPREFIEKVFESAGKAAKSLGVEREILIAQAALETGWGSKVFAKENGESTFNLFNIKADQRWDGDSVAKNTIEFLGGAFSSVAAKFRSYESINDSFNDFTQFIQNSERYFPVLNQKKTGLGFIEGIHRAGYATDPEYVSKIADVYDSVKRYLKSEIDVGRE